MKRYKNQKQKTVIVERKGIARIHATFNNTIVTITDEDGKTLIWSSGGTAGFKKSRRSTSYAANSAGYKVGVKARALGITCLDIIIKGIGEGRNTAPKGLQKSGLKIKDITDVTPIPHNGCRPRKRRRV